MILVFALGKWHFLIPINKWKFYNIGNSNYVQGNKKKKFENRVKQLNRVYWFSQFLMILTGFFFCYQSGFVQLTSLGRTLIHGQIGQTDQSDANQTTLLKYW